MHTPRTRFPSRRWAVRAGLPIGAGLALVAGLIVTLPAQAGTGNPYSPAAGHPYRHGVAPTRTALANMRAWNAAHPAAVQRDSANNLVYRGGNDNIGVTTGASKVYVVFYGSQWGTKSTDSKGNATFTGDPAKLAPRLQLMFKGLGTNFEQWSGTMTQYCEGIAVNSQSCPANSARVGYPFGGALAGVWYDNAAKSPQVATAHQLAVEAVKAAGHFGNSTPSLNRDAQYFIVSPHGTSPDGFLASDWCAWHGWNGDTGLDGGGAAPSTVGDIAFTNMPYLTDVGASCWANLVNAGSAGTLDGVTVIGGHEYAETITDQNPAGGWTDNSLPENEENADKCLGQPGAAGNVAFATGTFAMQDTWSNDANGGTGGCLLTHAIVGQDAFTVGYVWNDSPSGSGCHVPSTFYSYSSRAAAGTNTVCRTGTGAYTVHFAGLASKGGNAQVSAYGPTPANCKVSSWSASRTEELVKVNCYSFSGTAQDSYFTASFAKGGGSGNTYAFLQADQPTNTSTYTPSTTFQYNNIGGHATVKRTSTGRYTVTIPQSPVSGGGTVRVTAVGSGSGWCKVVNWFPASTAEQINVACDSSSGSASDQKFSLAFADRQNLLGDNLTAVGYAWADQPSAASYPPSLTYQYDQTIGDFGTVTISRADVGTYDVFLPFQDEGWDGGHFQVTAYGSGTEHCQISNWFGNSGGRTVRILCFANSGTPTDTFFVMEYTGRLQ